MRWSAIEREIRNSIFARFDFNVRMDRREAALKAALHSDCGPLNTTNIEPAEVIFGDFLARLNNRELGA